MLCIKDSIIKIFDICSVLKKKLKYIFFIYYFYIIVLWFIKTVKLQFFVRNTFIIKFYSQTSY